MLKALTSQNTLRCHIDNSKKNPIHYNDLDLGVVCKNISFILASFGDLSSVILLLGLTVFFCLASQISKREPSICQKTVVSEVGELVMSYT